jgi:hypothetical protein
MTDRLRVDGSGVAQLASLLERVSDELAEAVATLRQASPSGLGSPALDDACGDFAEDWEYGIGQLGKAADNVAKQLREGVRSYADTDDELARGLREAQS